MASNQEDLNGVSGWLALLVFLMLVAPLLGVSNFYSEITSAEMTMPGLSAMQPWVTYKAIQWILLSFFGAISVYGGYTLATDQTSYAVTTAKMVLWLNYPASKICGGMVIPAVMIPGSGGDAAMAIPSVIASFVFAGLWTLYLNKSKRVRITYNLAQSHSSLEDSTLLAATKIGMTAVGLEDAPQHHSSAVVANKTQVETAENSQAQGSDNGTREKLALENDNNIVYEKIALELESGNIDKGLWTRLFAECDGDEKQIKVRYIKKRAERLTLLTRLHVPQANTVTVVPPPQQDSAHESELSQQAAWELEKASKIARERDVEAEPSQDPNAFQVIGFILILSVGVALFVLMMRAH